MAKLQVIFVDDDAEDRELFEEAVGRLGFEVEVRAYERGQSFLDDCASTEDFGDRALLFLDLNMPELSGLEVLTELRKLHRGQGVPVVIFSTSGHESDVSEAYRRGGNAYLVKPSSFTELLATLRAALEFWSVAAIPSPT